jgi:hypothetical protein
MNAPPEVISTGDPATPRGRALAHFRRALLGLVALAGFVAMVGAAGVVGLAVEYSGTPSAAARGTGHDAEWLGHAWVDGRKSRSDVDTLARRLRRTGIHDLFVHTGPFNDDGTLDPALRPRADWLISALHAALPDVRVQAWLGAHPVPGHLHLDSAASRDAVLSAVDEILDDGFDGIHYDLEPVRDGDADLLGLLTATRLLTQSRHAILSVSAPHCAASDSHSAIPHRDGTSASPCTSTSRPRTATGPATTRTGPSSRTTTFADSGCG